VLPSFSTPSLNTPLSPPCRPLVFFVPLFQYLDGPEVDCDLVFSEGVCVFGAITDNWPTVEPYFNETGSNCPSILPRTAPQPHVAGQPRMGRGWCVHMLECVCHMHKGLMHVRSRSGVAELCSSWCCCRNSRQHPSHNFTLPCCAVPCCAVLCCAVLCCAVLCCAVLCCAVLQFSSSVSLWSCQ
jgi:hypothetical protein